MRFVRSVQASYRVFGAGGLFDLSDYHRVVRGCGAAALVLGVVFATTPQAAISQDVSLTGIAQIYGISADPFGEEILYLATGRGFFAVGPDGLAQLLSPGTNKFTGFAANPGRAGRFIAAGEAMGADADALLVTEGPVMGGSTRRVRPSPGVLGPGFL